MRTKNLHRPKSRASSKLLVAAIGCASTCLSATAQHNIALSGGALQPVDNATNSSFETGALTSVSFIRYGHPTPTSWNNWLFAGNCGVSRRNGGFGHGSQGSVPGDREAAFIQNSGTISSSVTVPAGGAWRLRFDATQRIYGPTNTQRIRVRLDGKIVAEFEPGSNEYEEYVTRPIHFPQGGSLSISFQGLSTGGDNTALIDHVELEPVSRWNDPGAWSLGTVPTDNERVTIPRGVEVALVGSGLEANNVLVEGELLVPDTDTDLTTHYLLVERRSGTAVGTRSGYFEVGQEGSSLSGEFDLTLVGTQNQPALKKMGAKFLAAKSGGQIELHGEAKKSWTKLTGVLGNSDRITVQGATGWEVGDKIVVAGSHAQWAHAKSVAPCHDPLTDESEVVEIVAMTVNQGVTELHINPALQYTHATSTLQQYDNFTGQLNTLNPTTHTNVTWTFDQAAEVGLLSKNIRIQGDLGSASAGGTGPGTGFGGHIMITQGGDYHLYQDDIRSSLRASNVEFLRMGQTKKLGRYPIHWHMMLDIPAGQYVKNCSIHDSFNRAVVVHSTDSILVEKNVVYGALGHAMFLEDGTEEDNEFIENLVVNTRRPSAADAVLPTDHLQCQGQNRSPGVFWITNPNNHFEGNVVAGAAGTAYWYIFPVTGVLVSNAEKANPVIATYANSRNPRHTTLRPGGFKDNVAHGCASGFDVNDAIRFNPAHDVPANETHGNNYTWRHNDPAGAVFENFVSYGCYDGIYTGPGSFKGPIYFDNAILADNFEAARLGRATTIRNSLFLRETGNVHYSVIEPQCAFAYYDGYGALDTCHLVGFEYSGTIVSQGAPYPLAAAVAFVGGDVTHAHNSLTDISFPYASPSDQLYFLRQEPASGTYPTTNPNYSQSVRLWGPTMRFTDGTPWETTAGIVPCTLTSSHDLVVTYNNNLTPLNPMPNVPGFNGARLTTDRYGLIRLFTAAANRSVDVSRDHLFSSQRFSFGTQYYELGGFAPHQFCPLILDDDFTYSVRISANNLPQNMSWPSETDLWLGDSEAQDAVVVRLVGCSAAYGGNFTATVGDGASQMPLPQVFTKPKADQMPSQSSFYHDGTDIWVAFVGAGEAMDTEGGLIHVKIED